MTTDDKLERRLAEEKEFHDEKYAEGDHFPPHYLANPTSPIYADMLNYVGSMSGKSVVEYGCGDGWCTVDLCRAGAQVKAFDISEQAIKQTRGKLEKIGLGHRFYADVMPAERLKYETGEFDIAFGFAILHHLDLSLAIPELYRVLKPGGYGIFAEPLQGNPLLRMYRRLTPQYRTPDEEPFLISSFESMFEGFSSVEHREYYLTGQAALALLYIPLLSRLYPTIHRWTWSFDAWILEKVPILKSWAWYSVLIVRK